MCIICILILKAVLCMSNYSVIITEPKENVNCRRYLWGIYKKVTELSNPQYTAKFEIMLPSPQYIHTELSMFLFSSFPFLAFKFFLSFLLLFISVVLNCF